MATPDIASRRLAAGALAAGFADLRPPLAPNEARIAAERCLFCFDAPCVTACPTSIDIPLFVRQIATANVEGAARTILDSNILGGMCARVCPTETLCEQACVRAAEERPIEIGRLQRHATDRLMESGIQPYRQGPSTGRSVAVVGAGPAGLACAHALAVAGHAVTIYEARPKLGGLNEYGIAAYKTVDGFAQREVAFVLGVGGINVVHGRRLGAGLTIDELAATHDAVFLAVGLDTVNRLGIEDALDGVVDGVSLIADIRQASDLAAIPIGRRVVVIGGGMTAIDVASQARRLGAEEVTIAYRRAAAQMGASPYEQRLAQTDGVLIRTGVVPRRVIAEGGRVVALEVERPATGERLTLPCDQLFRAIGQAIVADEVAPLAIVSGRIVVDEERRTSRPGVWAGGDCVAGGDDLTVTAVEDGKRAAASIDRALREASGG